jgi:hypothetical protein
VQARVTVDPSSGIDTVATTLTTQITHPDSVRRLAEAQRRLAAFAPALMRLHAGTDPREGAPLPAGKIQGAWDFSALNFMVNTARAAGAVPVLNVRYAPDWMWTCSRPGEVGTLRDQTFAEFAAYMARLVSYYSRGSMTTESGQTVTNPAGTANRIPYWELWNEPDLSDETPCIAPGGPTDAALYPADYVRMWNAVATQMLAIDPALRLVGPTTYLVLEGFNYVTELMDGAAHTPDAISFHGYGGVAANTDLEMFTSTPSGDGIENVVYAVQVARDSAPGVPIWLTELSPSVSVDRDDPGRRPWTAFGAAWGASAFRALTLAGASVIFQFCFAWPCDASPSSLQFPLVHPETGLPLLPYWRDLNLKNYFPVGSTVVQAASDTPGVEVLAAVSPRDPAVVRVLVINRQVANPSDVGGRGVPTQVEVRVAGAPISTRVTVQMLDDGTPLQSGPPLVALASGSVAKVDFAGYGAALLRFDRA